MARILLVEDDAPLRKLASTVLQQEGHEVVSVDDGRGALMALIDQRGGPFAVMVLDLMMPWIDGWQVLEGLREDHPKVIVITANEDPEAEKKARQTGNVFSFFVKPYDPEGLVAEVKAALAG